MPTSVFKAGSSGVLHPFRRGERDFENASGDANTLAKVSQVLGTSKGRLPWRCDFGSDLTRLRHKNNTPILRETARVFVDDALRKWVPEAQVVSVSASPLKDNGIDLEVVVQLGDKQQAITQRLKG